MKKESKLKKKFLKFEEKRKSLTSTYGMPWRHLRVAFIHQPVDAQVLSTGRSCKRNSRSKLMRRAIKLKVVALPHLVPHHVLCQRQRKPDCARTPMGPAFALDHARRLLCTDFGYISFMFARQITVHQCHEDVVNAASLQEFGFPDPVGAKPKAAQAAQTKSNGQAITLKERTASNLLHSRMPYRMRGMCEARVRCGGTVDSGLTNLPILIKPSSSPHEGFSFQRVSVDADLGGCPFTAKSTSGLFLVITGPNGTFAPIAWSSRRQQHVARSTADSELNALSEGVHEELAPALMLLQTLLGKETPKAIVKEDNSAVVQSVRKGYSIKLRHLARTPKLSLASLNEACTTWCQLEQTPTRDQLGDIFTKALTSGKFDPQSIGLTHWPSSTP